jgi:hypothetical protein
MQDARMKNKCNGLDLEVEWLDARLLTVLSKATTAVKTTDARI